jgi:hypothetical protein
VHVFGHDYVSEEQEFVVLTYVVEYFHKAVTHAWASQKGTAAITTESNEVQVALPVIAPQLVQHGREPARVKSKPAPLKTKGCGTHLYTYK